MSWFYGTLGERSRKFIRHVARYSYLLARGEKTLASSSAMLAMETLFVEFFGNNHRLKIIIAKILVYAARHLAAAFIEYWAEKLEPGMLPPKDYVEGEPGYAKPKVAGAV